MPWGMMSFEPPNPVGKAVLTTPLHMGKQASECPSPTSHSWKGGEQGREARQYSSEALARQHGRTLPPRLCERNELVEDGGTFLTPLKLQRKTQCWRRGRRAEGGL